MIRPLALVPAILVAGIVHAEPVHGPTYANPIDIDYRFNWEQENEGISYRTGADPAIVNHKGVYYLFQTLADGYWRSVDMVHWTFVTPSRWPARGIIAPAAWSDGERLYLMSSTFERAPIFVLDDPDSGRIEYLNRYMPDLPGAAPAGMEDHLKPGQVPPGPWDPALFKDDDGRWYMYWDSSNVFPLYGIELDPAKRLSYRGTPTPLFKLDPDAHGWERFGQDHTGTLPNGTPIKPFMEGAWMTKHAGRYYLQYGAPGTEYNVYANGTYVADKPLGPFTYAPWNPVAYKPGGFVEGAGHGSTVEDRHNNWWNSGTPWIGYNWTFERRIAIFPTRFYPDGQMAASTRFGDFPHYAPTARVDDPDRYFTGWMLLSYRKPAVASTTLGNFAASNATDENPRTFWASPTGEPGETLTLDLGAVKTVRALQVNFADYKAGRFADAPDIYTDFALQASDDGQSWREIARTEAPRRDRPNAYFELPAPVRARYIRYVHGHVGGAYLAIADLRVFGSAGGAAPRIPPHVTALRDTDARNGWVRFRPVPGAVGYNVRFGIRPDRLTLTYQLFADDPRAVAGALQLRALNVGVPYYAAVEAFNESGVSKLSRVIHVK